jgi:GMP synthase-like glutamine amidotransferase
MKVIVFQHAPVEHLGVFRDFFREDKAHLHTVELDEGETIPDLEPFDLMVVMGGPQDVWQEDQYPWMRAEKEAIRKYVQEMQRPYLGICLGHQLLADALGGRVGPAKTAEIGVMTVSKTAAGEREGALHGLPDPLRTLQWHGAEVTEPPAGSEILAQSDACRIQALRCGPRAYGLQFHVEVTGGTVADWAAIPEYAESLKKAMGPDAVPQLDDEVTAELPQFRKNARALYDNLKAAWAKA